MKLTETQIRSLKPREKLYRVADGHGLALEVTPNGSKLWRYRYSWAGKAGQIVGAPTSENTVDLGQILSTTLASIRKIATD